MPKHLLPDATKPRYPWVRIFLAYLWGMVWAGAGIIVGMTLLGIPIGVLLLMVAGFPLYKVLQKHFVRAAEWEHREHPLDNDEEEPWIL